ncbi:hypothetical protein ACP8Y2_14040 [Herpetosiphon llansteffanensis]
MHNRRIVLLMSLCAVLLGFAVARQPTFTSAKPLLTQTPSPTANPTCVPPTNRQAAIPNLTATPTPTANPCFVQPELVLSGPSQVQIGQLFTVSIQYINLGMPHASISLNDPNLAQFEPALTMPCKYNEHPTQCRSITLRATNVGTLEINATATGESYNNGWYWGSGSARAPLSIMVFNPNGNQTITPTATCFVNPPTPSPFVWPTLTPMAVGPRIPNLTATLPPTATPNDPCFIEPRVIISAPSQAAVGDLFTISIEYINLAAPFTSLYLASGGAAAHFEPPTNEVCVYSNHPTQCRSFTVRATAIGVFDFDAQASGLAYYNGAWHSATIDAEAAVAINIVEGAFTSTPTFTPVPTCVPPTTTAIPTMLPPSTPTSVGEATSTPSGITTRTPTPTLPSSPCLQTSYPEVILSAPAVVEVGDIFTLTIDYVNISADTTSIILNPNGVAQFDPPLPMPCRIRFHNDYCEVITMRATAVGELTINASSRGLVYVNNQWVEDFYVAARNPIYVNIVPRVSTPTPTSTPIVSELILSAPSLVNVGEAFSLTIQYVNIGLPYTGITLNPTGKLQFDPPLPMPCQYSQHPTQCRTIGLRAVAAGTIEIDAGATGEVPIAGGGWAWGSAQARNPITVQVRNLAHKVFIPLVKTQ